jgi:hypothetical protein
MRLQPLRDREGRALREQIKHVMALKIADHGPEPSASPPGPFVEPDPPGDFQEREGRTMDQTHNRPKTPWYAQCARELHPRAAANRDAHVPEGRTHAQTMTATDRDEGRETARQKSAVGRWRADRRNGGPAGARKALLRPAASRPPCVGRYYARLSNGADNSDTRRSAAAC